MRFTEYIDALLRNGNSPKWVREINPYASVLIVKRYKRRMQSRRVTRNATRYEQYLLTPHWQAFRMAVFVLCGGKCCRCGDVADHVHHLHYRTVGKEALCDVEPLCEACHTKEHRESDAL